MKQMNEGKEVGRRRGGGEKEGKRGENKKKMMRDSTICVQFWGMFRCVWG